MLTPQDFAKTSPGLLGTCLGFTRLSHVMNPESPDEYVATARSIEGLIADIDPDLVVIDMGFSSGRDAALRSGRPTVMLSPNTLKEIAAPEQELGVFRLPW
jgi:hypothetical protein